MKKGFLKRIFALGTTICLASSITVMADINSAKNVEIGGSGAVNSPIFDLTVPTDLPFAIDQYGTKGKGQIIGGDYLIVNQSNIPVTLSVSAVLQLEDGVSLAAPEEVDEASTGMEDDTKLLSFSIVPLVSGELDGDNDADSDSDSDSDSDTDTDVPDNEPINWVLSDAEYVDPYAVIDDSDTDVPGPSVLLGAAAAAAADTDTDTDTDDDEEEEEVTPGYVEFAFAAADYDEDANGDIAVYVDLAANDKGFSSFSFKGKVNANAPWETDDVKVSAKLILKGVIVDAYDKIELEDGALNVKSFNDASNAPVVTDGGGDDDNNDPVVTNVAPSLKTTTGTYTRNAAADVVYNFNIGSGNLAASSTAPITKISLVEQGGATRTPGTPSVYTVSGIDADGNGTITFTKSTTAIQTTWGTGTHTITITFSNNETDSATLIIRAS